MKASLGQQYQNANGELSLLGKLYSADQCNDLLSRLITEVVWSKDSCVIFGRRFNVPRLQAWYADTGIHYSYANNLLETQPWIDTLLNIKQDVEHLTGHTFNAVLLTYYRNGMDHVTWHADDEAELGEAPVIASLSLGEPRQFQFRNIQDGATDELTLHNGDLILMHPGFQAGWQHCVPVEPSISKPRINLTFRMVVPPV